MATINLGAIKFNWKGAYNNSTAYAVDDVVSSGGSSYVCILASTGNAVSNGTYWQVMAEGGDVATVLTAQGDILYRDGSGLQKLAAGTSGQALVTGGAGANPSWGTVSGGMLQTSFNTNSTSVSQGSTNYSSGVIVNGQITPSSATSRVLIFVQAYGGFNNGTSASRDNDYRILRSISGSDTEIFETKDLVEFVNGSNNLPLTPGFSIKDHPNTTSQVTYTLQTRGEGSGWDSYWNFDSTGKSSMLLIEIANI
jgi:hypothetical protein|tara:strand:+ start:401 stop:1159 length:759 start_codon:yes stop_codon:yes gene_type:complete